MRCPVNKVCMSDRQRENGQDESRGHNNVDLEIFARILFSIIALKDILVM